MDELVVIRKLVVISYNEGEQDFYESEMETIFNRICISGPNLTTKPDIICICTQKSKSQVTIAIPGKAFIQKKFGYEGSNSTKHFPHVFGNLLLKNDYKLVYKKDASFILRGVTENNNVRTRIYQLNKNENLKTQYRCDISCESKIKDFSKIIGTDVEKFQKSELLKSCSGCNGNLPFIDMTPNLKNKNTLVVNKLSSTIGSLKTMTLNRQAIYVQLDINGKKTIIVNTELAPDVDQKKQREKEFLDIIEEFKLAQKYYEGYNIILCGSLNFRLKFLTVVNEQAKLNLFNNLSQYIINSNKTKLLERNELRLYMKNLIDSIEKNKEKDKSINIIALNEAIKRNDKLRMLLDNFYENMKKPGFKFNCNYNLDNRNYRVYHPLKMGSAAKNGVNVFNSSHSIYKQSKNIATGVASGFASGVYRSAGKAATQILRQVPIVSQDSKNYFTENKKQKKKNFKLPAMCDKILFALPPENTNTLTYIDFNVFEGLKKSRNKLIYVRFTY